MFTKDFYDGRTALCNENQTRENINLRNYCTTETSSFKLGDGIQIFMFKVW